MLRQAIWLLLWLGAGYGTLGQSTPQVDSLKNILDSDVPRDSGYVRTLLNLANVVSYSDPAAAMGYTNRALTLAQQHQWPTGIALAYRQQGLVYYVQADYIKALDASLEALRQAAPLHHALLEASIYNNIANIYADMADYKRALEYYNRLLVAARAANSLPDLVNTFNNMGTVYVELQAYDTAVHYLRQAMELAARGNNIMAVASIQTNIGFIYKNTAQYDSSLYYFNKAIETAGKANIVAVKSSALSGLAQVYMLKKDYPEAALYGRQSLELARNLGALQSQVDAWDVLYHIYEVQQDIPRAYDAYKQFVTLRDSALNNDKKAELVRREMQFEKDKEKALSDAAIKRQKLIRNAVIGGAILLILSAAVIFFFYKKRRDAEARRKEAELKAQVTDTQMKVMRLQMNPHFIFNSLNSISDYIARNDVKEADAYLAKFARVMRMILERSEQKEIPLEEELEITRLYMELEALRLQHRLDYRIEVDGAIDVENTLVPPLILQPFIENSIWHGIVPKNGSGHILIQVTTKEGLLHCRVEDDGVGRKVESAAHSNRKSMGMAITKARIELLNKTSQSKGTLALTDLAQGLRVDLQLPMALRF